MSNSFFQFKQFTVWHDKCAMKVGTDGVLLGAWPRVDSAKRILDVGTGTGLVALMLAQRSEALIVAIDIDELAVEQATDNVQNSLWSDRIEVIHADFKVYTSAARFDVIVANPPYFVDSLKGPDEQRNRARHNGELSYEALLKGVERTLSDRGEFTMVVPTDVVEEVKRVALTYSLQPIRQLCVVTKPGATPKRALVTFGFGVQECVSEELLIEITRHQYSDAYIRLTKDYYLKM